MCAHPFAVGEPFEELAPIELDRLDMRLRIIAQRFEASSVDEGLSVAAPLHARAILTDPWFAVHGRRKRAFEESYMTAEVRERGFLVVIGPQRECRTLS